MKTNIKAHACPKTNSHNSIFTPFGTHIDGKLGLSLSDSFDSVGMITSIWSRSPFRPWWSVLVLPNGGGSSVSHVPSSFGPAP